MAAILTKETLQELALLRLKEAEALHQAGFFDAACYLCGYVVEFALKACVCKTLNVAEYPEKEIKGLFKTHLPAELILLAGLRGKLKQRQQESPDFAANWQIVTKWGPEQRYEKVKTASDTQELFDAVKAEPYGVLPWLINQS